MSNSADDSSATIITTILEDNTITNGSMVLVDDTQVNTSTTSVGSFSSLEETMRSINGEQVSQRDHLFESQRMNLFSEFFQTILNKLDVLENAVSSHESEKLLLNEKIAKLENLLEARTNYFNKTIEDAETRVTACEQYSRRDCIIITGIPDYIEHENLEENVIYILKEMGLNQLSSYDIAACHRLPKKDNNRFPAKTIVKFISRKDANFCLKYRKRLIELKNHLRMNLRIYESLCSSNEKILAECNNLKHVGFIYDFYIRNGHIKIIINEGDNPKKINHLNTLKETFKTYYEQTTEQTN